VHIFISQQHAISITAACCYDVHTHTHTHTHVLIPHTCLTIRRTCYVFIAGARAVSSKLIPAIYMVSYHIPGMWYVSTYIAAGCCVLIPAIHVFSYHIPGMWYVSIYIAAGCCVLIPAYVCVLISHGTHLPDCPGAPERAPHT
jgi:hypothetical protein